MQINIAVSSATVMATAVIIYWHKKIPGIPQAIVLTQSVATYRWYYDKFLNAVFTQGKNSMKNNMNNMKNIFQIDREMKNNTDIFINPDIKKFI